MNKGFSEEALEELSGNENDYVKCEKLLVKKYKTYELKIKGFEKQWE